MSQARTGPGFGQQFGGEEWVRLQVPRNREDEARDLMRQLMRPIPLDADFGPV